MKWHVFQSCDPFAFSISTYAGYNWHGFSHGHIDPRLSWDIVNIILCDIFIRDDRFHNFDFISNLLWLFYLTGYINHLRNLNRDVLVLSDILGDEAHLRRT